MHWAGPGEHGGGSYGRRAVPVATAERAAMQMPADGKGLKKAGWCMWRSWCRFHVNVRPIPHPFHAICTFRVVHALPPLSIRHRSCAALHQLCSPLYCFRTFKCGL